MDGLDSDEEGSTMYSQNSFPNTNTIIHVSLCTGIYTGNLFN